MNESQADANAPLSATSGVLDEALSLVEFLRARCPWDAAQTHHSLRRYLLEEAHEVVDAIDANDDRALADELGDLLLNLAFQIVIAEERRVFGRVEVVRGLTEKMRRRHPHIYGDQAEAPSWEAVKAAERRAGSEGVAEADVVPGPSGAVADRPGRGEAGTSGGGGTSEPARGLLGDLVAGSDPLANAYRIQSRVATVGFDWPDARGAWEKVHEEVVEVRGELGGDPLRLEDEIGDLLFAVVNLARLSGVHPTTALFRSSIKFGRRFARLEALAAARGIELETAGLETLDELWNETKREER